MSFWMQCCGAAQLLPPHSRHLTTMFRREEAKEQRLICNMQGVGTYDVFSAAVTSISRFPLCALNFVFLIYPPQEGLLGSIEESAPSDASLVLLSSFFGQKLLTQSLELVDSVVKVHCQVSGRAFFRVQGTDANPYVTLFPQRVFVTSPAATSSSAVSAHAARSKGTHLRATAHCSASTALLSPWPTDGR